MVLQKVRHQEKSWCLFFYIISNFFLIVLKKPIKSRKKFLYIFKFFLFYLVQNVKRKEENKSFLTKLLKKEVIIMRRKYNGTGYNVEAVWENLDKSKPIYSLSTELTPQYVWEDGKRTDKIISYKAGFTQEGAEYFQVKFPKKVNLPRYMSVVTFDNITAFQMRYDVYFKADDVKEVK